RNNSAAAHLVRRTSRLREPEKVTVMRKFIFSILLASAAASPALAQDHDRWHNDEPQSDRQEARQQAREARRQQHQQQQAQPDRAPRFEMRQQQQQSQPQVEARQQQSQG